jgi:hypothetical protein
MWLFCPMIWIFFKVRLILDFFVRFGRDLAVDQALSALISQQLGLPPSGAFSRHEGVEMPHRATGKLLLLRNALHRQVALDMVALEDLFDTQLHLGDLAHTGPGADQPLFMLLHILLDHGGSARSGGSWTSSPPRG